ncbi:GDSL-type esterase/lipase family protein [Propionibacteriaceae bacterium Y1700]|uniref:GDSL-type esterase/lipase family protein n=1 Tax=Microlunatus sp. Y1700 TaxID=3418487 RepID=UPI003DA723CF
MTSLQNQPLTSDLIRGALEVETTARGLRPHRLPDAVRRRDADSQLLMTEAEPSGVRLALHTAATVLELETLPTRRFYPGAPARPHGSYDLVVDGELQDRQSVDGGDILALDMATGGHDLRPGVPGTLRFELPGRPCRIEIWLPHNETTELIALRANAPIEPAAQQAGPVWLHHGSSISQGSNAVGPTDIWPVLAARAAGVDLVNLGFGGSAMLDPFMARVMRDQPADLLSVKIGINVVNGDVMRLRAFTAAVHGFLDTIRDGHPDAPLLVITPTFCAIHEATPGPGGFDMAALGRGEMRFLATGDPAGVAGGQLTLQVIREELGRIVTRRAEQDPQLHLLDGLELYGEADAAEHPLPDNLHPDSATHRLIGERFTSLALTGSGPLSPSPLA